MAYDDIINAAGQQYGIDPDLLRAQMMRESQGNPKAVSPKGALGLMQLMPGTAQDLGVTNVTDPQQNIMGGAKYMRQLIDKYGDLDKAVQAYNMGPAAYDKYASGQRGLPEETSKYLDRVSSTFAELKKGIMPQQTSTTAADEWLGQSKPATGGVSTVDAWLGAGTTPQPVQQAQAAPVQQQTAPTQRSAYDELARQVGLTARAGVTGIAGLPNMVGDAANSLINMGIGGVNRLAGTNIPQLQMPSEVTQRAMNAAGIPQPENATERVVQDVAGAMAGAGGQVSAGRALANQGTGVLSRVGNVLATAPGMQITGAAGGAAGQGIAREEGAGPMGQIGAALVGSAVPVVAGSAITRALSRPPTTFSKVTPDAAPDVAQRAVKNVARETGMPLSQSDAKAVEGAIIQNPGADPKALARALDFREVGVEPTLGQLTRDPAQYARERNIRGVQGVGDPLLARLANQNNQLQDRLNALRGQPMETYQAGRVLSDSLEAADESLRKSVTDAYSAARLSTGKDLNVPLQGLSQKYAETLKNFGDKIPSGVRNNFEELGLLSGKQRRVFTIEDADKLSKVINANHSNDPAVNKALGDLSKGVKDAVLSADPKGGAFAPAVALAKKRFDLQDAIPALKAASQGTVAPDDFVKRFVINGKTEDVNALSNLLKETAPDAFKEARSQLGNELNRAAFGANIAGDKQFSPERYAEALRKIGTAKLGAFFTPEEVADIQRVGRVGAYINAFPAASTVNTSNTAALAANLQGRLPDLIERVPLPGARLAGNLVRSATKGIEERQFVADALAADLKKRGNKMTTQEAELAAKLLLQPAVRVPVAKP